MIVNQAEPIDTQSTHLGNIDVGDYFIIHVDKGVTLGIVVKDAKGSCKVHVLSGTSNGSVGDNGGFSQHV